MAPRSLLKTPIDRLPLRNSKVLFLSCLTALILSNALLSYSPLSIGAKTQVFFWGLALPIFLLSLFYRTQNDPFQREFFPSITLAFFILLVTLALFVRFFRLSSLSTWPVVDEGIGSYFAIHLGEKWDWDLLQGPSQEPRLYTWSQALLFKIFPPSLFSLWLLPALWATLTLPAAWWAARTFLSRSLSFLFVAFMAFGTWPLLLGRFSTQSVLLVFWECLCLGLLGWYLRPSEPTGRWKKVLILGTAVGVGFYTYLSWPLVALMITVPVFWSATSKKKKDRTTALLFLLPPLALLLPWALTLSKDYRGYFHHIWNGSGASWTDRISIGLSYFEGIFWGTPGASFHFGPVWGGLLDPLSGSLFMLGLLALVHARRDSRAQWILAALALFFIPALLTNDFEMMRLCQLAPLVLLVSAIGATSLFSSIGWHSLLLLSALLLASCGLDLYHLLIKYPNHWRNNYSYYGDHKSVEFEKAYRLLEERSAKEGPGLIWLNSLPDPYDQTLFTATYAFNAAVDPALKGVQPKWAAILTNVHEEPYLKKNFPGMEWAWLSEGLGRQDGGYLLAIFPITPENAETVARWTMADRSLKDLTYLVMELGVDPDQSQMRAVLDKAFPLFQGDRLLESRYWRISALHRLVGSSPEEAILDERKALERGYPMAHLYNEMGCLLFKEKKFKEAEEAFRKALGQRPNCTGAEENLKVLTSK